MWRPSLKAWTRPNPALEIAAGGLLGAALPLVGAGLAGSVRATRRVLSPARDDTLPPDIDAVEHATRVDAAEADLDAPAPRPLPPRGEGTGRVPPPAAVPRAPAGSGDIDLSAFDARSVRSLQQVDGQLQSIMAEAYERTGKRFVVIEGQRPQSRQDALYAQGRTRPGNQVTWTRDSDHTGGGAVDIAIVGPDGRVNQTDIDAYREIGPVVEQIARERGIDLDWGGKWSRKDWGHFQVNYTPDPKTARIGDDAIVDLITTAESGGIADAANPNSTAVGLGQFTEDTWLETIRRYRPDLTEGRSPNQILALRRDRAISREMTVAYTAQNRATLRGAGLQDGPKETYLMHFAGPTGGVRILRATPDRPIREILSPAAMQANANIRHNGTWFKDMSAGQLILWAATKMGRTGTGGNGGGGVFVPTSRGYTTSGQSSAGDYTVDVEYEVVDASILRAASGDLQPRDRSRASSDEQINDIAARLDPARLLPSPDADRGAPIVGPDGIVESGNGRVAAIRRAGEIAPDRAAAYRQAIGDAGYTIPEGVGTPVLIARRQTDLSPVQRQEFVRAANTSTIARMSATERSAMDARAVSAEALARYRPDAKLTSAENAGFLRAVLDGIPQTERAGLVTDTGRINREGLERVRQAMFARAFDADDIRAAAMEVQSPEIASLIAALEEVAPDWAKMRAAIDSGDIRPEMDIGGHVQEAMRLIAVARETATREKSAVAALIEEMLADVDLIDGALAPLSAALVRKMAPGGRVAPSDKLSGFLRRYASEATKVGQTGEALFDAPGPLDVLKRLDAEAFGDLTETGTPRGQGTGGAGRMDPAGDAEDYAAGAEAPAAIATSAQLRQELDGRVPATEASEGSEAFDQMRRDLADLADDPDTLPIDLGDGTLRTPNQILDDLDRTADLDAVLDACPTGRGL